MTRAAASEQRKDTTSAIDCGVFPVPALEPPRAAVTAAMASSSVTRSVGPGATAFTVMPRANSRGAIVRVIQCRAAFPSG